MAIIKPSTKQTKDAPAPAPKPEVEETTEAPTEAPTETTEPEETTEETTEPEVEVEVEVEEKVEVETETTEPSGLGTNSVQGSDTPVSSVPNPTVDYNPEVTETPKVDYKMKANVTVGDLLDMHRMLSYCLRGNQRPAVLQVQQKCVALLPKGTPIIHREAGEE